jgi:A/G-specific adenine glycosylase
MTPPRSPTLVERLGTWFDTAQRALPWRQSLPGSTLRDPYRVWVSEIMLQQTRVDVVVPYFERWMARFPTVTALAEAPLDEVLRLWAGLGYYARARNLHAGAREVVALHGGALPRDPAALGALKGVGPYTQGAILSLAFGVRAALVDGNVARVLQRLLVIEGSFDQPAVRRRVWQEAEALVPARQPGGFNEALMELGAMVCTPTNPRCDLCPVRAICGADRQGRTHELPAPKVRRPPRELRAVALLVERGHQLLLLRRPSTETLWGGLWEPPWGEVESEEAPSDAAHRILHVRTGLSAMAIVPCGEREHVLTHRRIRFALFRVAVRSMRTTLTLHDQSRWLGPDERRELPVALAAWSTAIVGIAGADAPQPPPVRAPRSQRRPYSESAALPAPAPRAASDADGTSAPISPSHWGAARVPSRSAGPSCPAGDTAPRRDGLSQPPRPRRPRRTR